MNIFENILSITGPSTAVSRLEHRAEAEGSLLKALSTGPPSSRTGVVELDWYVEPHSLVNLSTKRWSQIYTCNTGGEPLIDAVKEFLIYEGINGGLEVELTYRQTDKVVGSENPLSGELTASSEGYFALVGEYEKFKNKHKTCVRDLPESEAPDLEAPEASGSKYHRTIYDCREGVDLSCVIDIYEVLRAYDVTCPAQQHALKKLLCPGKRGKGSVLQDLNEAQDALIRAAALAARGADA